jgi:hypothetical protein
MVFATSPLPTQAREQEQEGVVDDILGLRRMSEPSVRDPEQPAAWPDRDPHDRPC